MTFLGTLDELKNLRLLVVDTAVPQRAGPLPGLQASGFHRIENAFSLAQLRERLLRSLQNRERDLALVIIAAELWNEASEREADEIRRLAGQGEIALALAAATAPDEADLEHARKSGFVDVLDVRSDPARLLERLALILTLRQERLRLREREDHLENELAARRVMETRLQFIAFHDELTGLFNRRRIKQELELALLRVQTFRKPVSLLLLDLDRFKLINDLEGNEVGDRLLIEIARQLVRFTRPGDVAGRIGSDEFVLLLDRCDESEALQRADALRRQLEDFRFRYDGREYQGCASFGLATAAPGQTELTASEMLGRADQACYLAKKSGRNRIHVFNEADPQLRRLRSDFDWAPRIRRALEHDGFFFQYQPVVRVADGKISHYEMLIRMYGEDGRVYGPGEFIPAAERNGLIHQIDLWAVDKAVDFLAELPPSMSDLCANINLSAHAFNNSRLLPLLAAKLKLRNVAAERLVFELTETAAIENFEQSRQMVARLRALGCRFALDDFGAGFSTYQYLKKFPVDYLKLDGSFIVNLKHDPVDQQLVRHMIAVGHGLGKKIVAEFVEDAETYCLLHGMGVDYTQGHFLSVAVASPADVGPLPPETLAPARQRADIAVQDAALPDSTATTTS